MPDLTPQKKNHDETGGFPPALSPEEVRREMNQIYADFNKAVAGNTAANSGTDVDEQKQQLVNAVSDGIAQHNAIGLVIFARIHFGICMALFSLFAIFGGIDAIKKTAIIGIPVTLPGLLGFVDLKKVRGEK